MANDKVYPNYLMHYRTKGSKNGYSKSKYYTPVGQKAKGRWVNGKYVYDGKNSYELGTYEKNHQGLINGKRQSWQQIGNSYRAANEAAQKAGEGKSKMVDINGTGFNQRKEASNRYINAANKTVIKNMFSEGSKNAWQQQANYQKEKDKKHNDAIAKGAKNNWQQKANHFRTADESINRMAQERSKDAYVSAYSDASNAAMKKYLRNDGVALRLDESYKNALTKNANNKNAENQAHSYYLMKNTKSAMGNDPRYEKSPYSAYIHNKQELAAAKAKSKARINDTNYAKLRNSRSDIGNAIADAKEDAKKKWKDIKKSAKKTASKIGKKGKSLVEKFKNLFK